MMETAIVYCESEFGKMDGKTANGLIRSSGKYKIAGVIDSTKAGMDAGKYLDGKENGIPIFKNLAHALKNLPEKPDQFIIGIAPSEALLKNNERDIILEAMENSMHIINPLHEFFTDDKEFVAYAEKCGVTIQDIRKPAKKEDLHLFTGKIFDVTIPTVAVLGTDGAVGKRTISVLLEEALIEKGLRVAFIATGQTGLIQGKEYGVAIDAIPSQFMSGEIENQMMRAVEKENPDIIIVEGQGALSHPAYISSAGIIRGSRPGAVIVQHPPKRKYLGDFNFMEMPTLENEISLIETFSEAKVIAVSINHENMSDKEIEKTILAYENSLELKTTDVFKYGCDKLISSIFEAYPELKQKVRRVALI